MKACRVFLSCTGSPDSSSSFEPGPKIARISSLFSDLAAASSALPASSGVAKALAAEEPPEFSAFWWHDARGIARARITISRLATAVRESLCDIVSLPKTDCRNVADDRRADYLRKPPPPRLMDPRELAARDCHPLLPPSADELPVCC